MNKEVVERKNSGNTGNAFAREYGGALAGLNKAEKRNAQEFRELEG